MGLYWPRSQASPVFCSSVCVYTEVEEREKPVDRALGDEV